MNIEPTKPTSKNPPEQFAGDVWLDPIALPHEGDQPHITDQFIGGFLLVGLVGSMFIPCASVVGEVDSVAAQLAQELAELRCDCPCRRSYGPTRFGGSLCQHPFRQKLPPCGKWALTGVP